MWWLRNSGVVIVVMLVVAACGFQPVHRQSAEGEMAASSELIAISVQPVAFGRAGQVLQTQLQDMLNPTARDAEKKYTLTVQVTKNIEPLVIEQDRQISRYNLVINGKYELKSLTTGAVLDSGKIRLFGSYDAVESDFSTFKAEEDTTLRIMREMAREVRHRVAAHFTQAE